ncbi:MAG TPA: zf-HC2 domain-containing protein [Dehalococcoidia bacterium]|jgi:anti-sigma factor RsiW|nr:zf-HC2 domain-containing protein [Dehalococcoidia bacterium]
MTCDQIDELLSDYIDEELTDGARAGVEAHLRSCAGCAASYKQLVRTVRFVRKNGPVPIRSGTGGELYANFTRAQADPSLQDDPVGVLRESIDGLP